MNLYDIESFLMIVQKGSFSKAADALALTQPALSQRIKLLEDEIGYSLFKRQKGARAVELTDLGRNFVDVAKQMLNLWKTAQAVDQKEQGMLCVSITDSVAVTTLSSVGRQFAKENPDIQISIKTFRSSESPQRVESGEVDLAIVGAVKDVPGSVECVPIYSEPRVFVCAPDAGYPDCVHPSILSAGRELTLLCNLEVVDWQEHWFSNGLSAANTHINVDRLFYTDRDLFEGGTWAVVPMSIANLLHETIGASIHTIKDGPPPRIVYAMKRFDNESGCVKKFLENVYRQIQRESYLTQLYQENQAN